MNDLETNLQSVESIIREKLAKHADSSLSEKQLLEFLLTAGDFENEMDSQIRRAKGQIYFYSARKALVDYSLRTNLEKAAVLNVHPSALSYLEVNGEVLMDINEKNGAFYIEVYEGATTHNIDLSSVNFEDYKLDVFADIELQKPTNQTLHFANMKDMTNFMENKMPPFIPVHKKSRWFSLK